MSIKKITVITRLTTQNAGNEALSRELIRFLKKQPDTEIRALDRYPMYLEHLTLRKLGAEPWKLIENFNALLDRLHEKFISTTAELAPFADECLVKLQEDPTELPLWAKKVKRKIGYRRNLAALGLVGKEEAFRAFNTVAWADMLIWNPAGEFHPTGNPDQTFRLLLLVALAQKLGIKTAIINHSLEIADDALRELVALVYRRTDFISVREQPSVDRVLELGVNPKRVHLTPDLVFLASTFTVTSEPDVFGLKNGAIGFAINGLGAYKGHNEWHDLFTKLKDLNRQFVFVSNAVNHDLSFSRAMADRYGGLVIERQPNYLELRRILAKLDVVISSRLHTSILALCEGTPVITIEPSVFKLTGVFDNLRYPIRTKDVGAAGWGDAVLDDVHRVLTKRNEHQVFARDRLAEQVGYIEARYGALLEDVRVISGPHQRPQATHYVAHP